MTTTYRQTDAHIPPELFRQLAYNERMAEFGRISAGLVHELNAPLSVIVSAAQMIMREEELSGFAREMLDRISHEAQRLSIMTRGLLGFSSGEDGVREADVNLTAGFVLDFVAFEAARRGVTLERRFDHSLPVARADGNHLKQILLNLVMNALQAMETCGGGGLTVETVSPREGFVALRVVDTGPGIAPDLLSSIFTPYFTTKEPGKGTGLGLYVTRTLTENMDGVIEVNSTPGSGTSFLVTLPAAD